MNGSSRAGLIGKLGFAFVTCFAVHGTVNADSISSNSILDEENEKLSETSGYLNGNKVRLLQKTVKSPARDVSASPEPDREEARTVFQNLKLGCHAKREVYRGLYTLGFVSKRTAFPDFLSDETVISGVSRYQDSIGAKPTGFLSNKQISSLKREGGKTYLWESKICNAEMLLFPLREWYAAGYSDADKQEVFDILEAQGFLKGDRLSNRFSDRDNKAAVKRYQASIGAEQTGYLTNRQADDVLHRWQPLTPKQQWVALAVPEQTKRDLFRVLYAMGRLKSDVPQTDFTTNYDLITAVSSFQSLAGFRSTGFLTKKQVKLLLARNITPTPFEQAQSAAEWSNPVMAWRYADYSAYDLALIYRALYNRGFFYGDAVTSDLTRPDLVSYIQRYQAYIAADPTGYLTGKQIAVLLADPGEPTPWEKRQKKPKLLKAAISPEVLSSGRESWQKLGYSSEDKKRIYRALYQLELATSPQMLTDFSFRIDLIKIVRAYQDRNGHEATGFLTSEQADELLDLGAPLLPSEQQELLFQKLGRAAILSYLRDLGEQEYAMSNPMSAVVKRFQDRFGMRADGFVTSELFDHVRTVPLIVVREQSNPQTLFFNSEELPASRDWRLWKDRSEGVCEASTNSIHEDGFTGSASPSSVALLREDGWERNAVNSSIHLSNWKPNTIAEMRVDGRSYYVKFARGRTWFVAKDGSMPRNPQKNYSALINGMLRANGFEITYETVFGTKVVASFSALGLTKQLRALMKAC
ncbi:hypothetical protein [Roseibium sp.]|uniref:hypothetical protein n=1 Tax=Roseibium sp. TaxID=1936156 RepID=UPI003D134BA3